jgi:hypothetical protein
MYSMSFTLFNATIIIYLIGISVQPTLALRDFIPKSDLPKLIPKSRESDWVSWDEDSEFLPADQSGSVFATELARRMLSLSSTTSNPYSAQAYVNGDYEYNGYQQAWRYLGFMIDCDTATSSSQRGLKSGSGDQTTGEGCSRYVLWAAYVDLEYEGGGIGEYQYWDRWKNQWDTSSCNYSSNNKNKNNNNKNNNNNNEGSSNRCAKMDCHLEDTHFSLLGIFKHKDYNEWMGQLFKHEGMCIWSQDEYSFMKQARKAWPQGCTLSGSYYIDGNSEKPLYYDLQPASQGDITVALYTDTRCTNQYVPQGYNDPLTVENVLGNIIINGGSGKSRDNNQGGDTTYSTLSEALNAWDSAFDIFKICQPCIAYDRFNVGWNNDDDSSKGSNYYNYNGNDGGGSNYNDFDCYDDAGYTNVNQVSIQGAL